MSEQERGPLSGDLSAGFSEAGPNAAFASDAASQQSKSQKSKPQESKLPEPPLGSTPQIGAEAPRPLPEQGGSAEKTKASVEAPRTDGPRPSGKIMIMSPSHDGSHTASDQDSQTSAMFSKRRLSALAVAIAIAGVSAAIGGALAVTGLGHLGGNDETKAASIQNRAVEESIMRIDAELAALKKLSAAQSAKLNERIDKVEKAQAEPVAKLAKLSDMVEKLRVGPPPAPASVPSIPAKEVTGSIPLPAPRPEAGRLPTVQGWALRDVADGGALIEGRQGLFQVFAGDPVPGLGRVDAIRRQDGRWVVVTSKGLIVAR